jgi:hypothetical protein
VSARDESTAWTLIDVDAATGVFALR